MVSCLLLSKYPNFFVNFCFLISRQHPRTSKRKFVTQNLPLGWDKVTDEHGKVLFINSEKNIQTDIDPRIIFAKEQTSHGPPRQKFDASSTALAVLHGKDLSGKVALITGASDGIGLETARSLAIHGAEIIFACRNRKKSEIAMDIICNETPNAKLKFIQIDLTSLSSCKKFVEDVKNQYQCIDYLILNAGIFALPYSLTEDGFETIFQVSHLSHFYITMKLSELLKKKSRVVILSSESHRFSFLPSCGLTKEHLSPPQSKFWSMIQYNNSKLCNVLFAHELARRWFDRGILVFVVHPGNMVSTGLPNNYWFYRFLFKFVKLFTKTLQQAAATSVYCATHSDLDFMTGLYFNNCYICEPSKLSQNLDLARELWELSENMIRETVD
jgi:WW domain-containing oxidoreductase